MSRIADLVGAVLPNIAHVVKRFPLSVLFSCLMTVWVLYLVASRHDYHDVTYALLAMFFTSVAATLVAERRGWGLLAGSGISLIGAAVIGVLFYFPEITQLTPVMFILSCLIGASLFAYIGMPIDNRSYWFFNHCFWFNLLIGLIGGLLVAGLVALLIGAYSTLFDMHVSSRLYGYSFVFSLFFIAPMIWLSLIPTRFDEQVVEGEQVEFSSKLTSLFVKYVFVPFFFLFVFLFHGLALKIGLDGSFPKGQIGLYGLALVVGCIGTYLMAFPTRNSAGPLVKLFSENWIWFLIVPLGLILGAHFIRINEYGMTPLRFYMTGLFVWAFVLIGYSVFVRVRGIEFDLRTILFLAMLVIGVSSFGPWGAEAVSLNWQKQRLVEELADRGVLEGGVIVRQLAEEPDASHKRKAGRDLSGVLNFFKSEFREEALLSLLPEDERKKVQGVKGSDRKGLGRYSAARKNPIVTAVRTQLGLSTLGYSDYAQRSHFSFSASQPTVFPVSGEGKLIGQFFVNMNSDKNSRLITKNIRIGSNMSEIGFIVKDGKIIVKENGQEVSYFSYQSLIELAEADQKIRLVKPYRADVQSVNALAESKFSNNRLLIQTMSYSTRKDKKAVQATDIDVRSDSGDDDIEIKSIGFYYFMAGE